MKARMHNTDHVILPTAAFVSPEDAAGDHEFNLRPHHARCGHVLVRLNVRGTRIVDADSMGHRS